MTLIDGRTGLEKLGDRACWELLGAGEVGRVAVVVDGAPQIFPVNYLALERAIYFRTDEGTKLRGLVDDRRVAFEIDGVDPMRRTGWSVLVNGRAEVVTDSLLLRRLREQPLHPWAVGPKSTWVRVSPLAVSGRRIPPRRGPSDH
jgi:nitroimidazol reductase NimA-like FMN-containing flavoprotein (pyridoxamine 5'-phosphate oxidase superfamily)